MEVEKVEKDDVEWQWRAWSLTQTGSTRIISSVPNLDTILV